MNHSKKVLPLAQLAFRQFGQTVPKNTTEIAGPRFKKLKEIQQKFGIEDNVPVHLKGGVFDRLLYQATAVITLVGVGLSLQTFYQLINK